MKFGIRQSLLLSLSLLWFTAVAADIPEEPYINDAPLVRRQGPLRNETASVLPSSSRRPSVIPSSGRRPSVIP